MFDDPNVVLHCEKIDKIYPGTWMTKPIQRVRKKSCSVWNMKFHRKPWLEIFV